MRLSLATTQGIRGSAVGTHHGAGKTVVVWSAPTTAQEKDGCGSSTWSKDVVAAVAARHNKIGVGAVSTDHGAGKSVEALLLQSQFKEIGGGAVSTQHTARKI